MLNIIIRNQEYPLRGAHLDNTAWIWALSKLTMKITTPILQGSEYAKILIKK